MAALARELILLAGTGLFQFFRSHARSTANKSKKARIYIAYAILTSAIIILVAMIYWPVPLLTFPLAADIRPSCGPSI